MGKPHNVEEFQDFLKLVMLAGDRREHRRFDVVLGVRLSRLEAAASADGAEQALTENLSAGGARVRSQLGASKGEIILLEEARGAFRSRAQIQDVTGSISDRRLHLRFIDGTVPPMLFEQTGF